MKPGRIIFFLLLSIAAKAESPSIQKGDRVVLLQDEPLYFKTDFFRSGKKGEEFEVVAINPSTQRVFLKDSAANGAAIAVNLPSAGVNKAVAAASPAPAPKKAAHLAGLGDGPEDIRDRFGKVLDKTTDDLDPTAIVRSYGKSDIEEEIVVFDSNDRAVQITFRYVLETSDRNVKALLETDGATWTKQKEALGHAMDFDKPTQRWNGPDGQIAFFINQPNKLKQELAVFTAARGKLVESKAKRGDLD